MLSSKIQGILLTVNCVGGVRREHIGLFFCQGNFIRENLYCVKSEKSNILVNIYLQVENRNITIWCCEIKTIKHVSLIQDT